MLAERLKCNLFIEKNHIKSDILNIADEMINYRKKFVNNLLEKINNDKEHIKRLQQVSQKPPAFPEDLQAANRAAYEKCKSNLDWVLEHQGKYAAFVDGEFKFSCKDRDEFFNQLINSDKYKEKQIFFAEVGEKERIIDEPTSLWFELI